MTIDTLSDWNTRLGYCGCCAMPSCPVPTQECESITVTACGTYLPAHPDVPPEDACKLWKTKTSSQNVLQSGSITDGSTYEADIDNNETRTGVYESRKNPTTGVCEIALVGSSFTDIQSYVERPFGGGDPVVDFDYTQVTSGNGVNCPGTETFTDNLDSDNNFSNPVDFCPNTDVTVDNSFTYASFGVFTKTELDETTDPDTSTTYSAVYTELTVEDVKTELDEKEFPDDADGTSCEAAMEGNPLCEGSVTGATKVRYRWAIPNDFEGSYFKITWDILTEPEGWDNTIPDPENPEGPEIPDPAAPNRSYQEDLTWEWAGPGTADPDSWKSTWFQMDAPSEVGVRRVVNIRYECYRSPYGSKPELTGEGVDLDEASPLQARFTTDRHAIHAPLFL
jgi:hypothetical protein